MRLSSREAQPTSTDKQTGHVTVREPCYSLRSDETLFGDGPDLKYIMRFHSRLLYAVEKEMISRRL